MEIWNSELKELEKLHATYKGQDEKLDVELEKLTKATDENMILVYARRCLELVITELCERELKRSRGTDPLKGIIDRLNREEIVPDQIIVSMQNLNNLSTFGAHPKDFDSRQVKPVLIDLITTLEWYQQNVLKKITEGKWPKPEHKQVQANLFKVKPNKSRKPGLIVLRLFLALVLVGLAIFIINLVFGEKKIKAGTVDSLMMLPFGNYTGNDSLEYFVSGMYSEMIGNIGKVSGLRVISETTSKACKNGEKTLNEIAHDLNVDVIIEPSVICFGDSICIQFKAFAMYPEEKQIWVGTYKDDKSQILNLYNHVTKEIAEELKLQLSPKDVNRLSRVRTVNTEAYDAYLKGMYYISQMDKENIEKGMNFLFEAAKIDPNEPFVYTALALGYIEIAHSPYDPGDALAKAETFALKAFSLDSTMAETYSALAEVYLYDLWEFQKAEKMFVKALEINPNLASCHLHYAWAQYLFGRMNEAIKENNLAKKCDPLNPMHPGWLGLLYCYNGQFDLAFKEAQDVLKLDKDYALGNAIMGIYYLSKGMEKEAIEAHKKASELGAWSSPLCLTYVKTGHLVEANALLAELEKSEVSPWTAYERVAMYAALGNKDKAFEWLNYKPHHVYTAWVAVMPEFENLHGDPRFNEFVKNLNLPK